MSYASSALLQEICDNLGGTVEEGSDYLEVRTLRGIVAAVEGEAAESDYERIELLRAWLAATGEAEADADGYEEIEVLRAVAVNYEASVPEGSEYEAVRVLQGIRDATAEE